MTGKLNTDLTGFFKVQQDMGGTLITATFWNPETGEERHPVVRDYDYADRSRDRDDLYDMEIDKEIRKNWLHSNGIILAGDKIFVCKGRKVPIGTIAKVVKCIEKFDKYHRWVADYVVLDNGMQTNVSNCVLILDTSATA